MLIGLPSSQRALWEQPWAPHPLAIGIRVSTSSLRGSLRGKEVCRPVWATLHLTTVWA